MEFKLAIGIGFVVFAHGLGCSSQSFAPTPYAHMTSAEIIAGGSPDLRTLDNTGFVYPGGQTREVSAGVVGGLIGGGRGDGVPPPHRERPQLEDPSEDDHSGPPPPSGVIAAPVDAIELAARMADAICDQETYCGRTGTGRPFGSVEDCRAVARERARHVIDAAECREIRGDRISTCLAAIHLDESCEAPLSAGLVPSCTPQALCDPGPGGSD